MFAVMKRLRLIPFGIFVVVYHLAASVLVWNQGWPPQFGGDPDPDQSYLSYLWGGSAMSAPLPPLLALVIGLVLSRRADAWRLLGRAIIAIVAILFVIGVFGELFAEHPHVPAAVIALGGLINLLLAGGLFVAAMRERGPGRPKPDPG